MPNIRKVVATLDNDENTHPTGVRCDPA